MNFKLNNFFLIAVTLLYVSVSFHQKTYSQKINLVPQDWKAGDRIEDPLKWVEVGIGDIPLVISVPHGGTFHDDEIMDRDCKDVGRVVKGVDSKTISTARAIEEEFAKNHGSRPYVVMAKLSRRKVDQNREIKLAACSDPFGEIAWKNYHSSIEAVIKDAVDKFGYVLFVDLHGHGHTIQRLELGYALNKNQLQTVFNDKDADLLQKSSMVNLLNVAKKNIDLTDVLFGSNSLGAIFANEGFPATPSMQDTYPVKDEKFFSGGHITRKFTSSTYPNVFGLQIECNYKGVRDTPENRSKFGKAFAKAYTHFLNSFVK